LYVLTTSKAIKRHCDNLRGSMGHVKNPDILTMLCRVIML